MRQLHVITDLQFGSTGKGLFAGFLAKKEKPDTLLSAWGPNAGHTFIDSLGNKHVNIMVPNGIVSPSVKQILIGPGSIIDPIRLVDEMTRYGLIDNAHVKVAIHEHAAVVDIRHRALEAGYGFGIGSTMKGVGEAVIEKLRRVQDGKIVAKQVFKRTILESYLVSVAEYNDMLDASEVAILEGAQGFSLSINQGIYPYTTSRDCTTHQLLSDCGVPFAKHGDGHSQHGHGVTVYGVCRTYPIRVANRYAKCDCVIRSAQFTTPSLVCPLCSGTGQQMIGTSGPGYHDQHEIGWESIGRAPELTTVTKLPRRLFTFSREQIAQAIRMNGVDQVFLNFCNYVGSAQDLLTIYEKIENAGGRVTWTGWGEREDQIHTVNKIGGLWPKEALEYQVALDKGRIGA